MRSRKRSFLLIGFCLIGLLLCSTTIRHARRLAAVKQVERIGGYVTFIHHGPGWLVKCLGIAYPFKSVLEIGLIGTNVTDSNLSVVEPLNEANIVLLNAANVRGPGLALLRDLPRLEELDLTKSGITDDGLKYLSSLQKLRKLSLARTQITDQGIFHLEHLNNLQELDLEDTAVTDISLQYLSRLPLKWLNVRRTLITSEGLSELKKRNPTLNIIQ